MKIKQPKFVKSILHPAEKPVPVLPEFAFVGRSNVGKSSLINTLVNIRHFARVSKKPGKTRTIKFFNIDNRCYFVDLPGYGYARASRPSGFSSLSTAVGPNGPRTRPAPER